MKVLKLLTENVKRVQFVEIRPQGAVVEITGENGAGKTSVLNSIAWALGGEKLIQAIPLREGEDEGRIEVVLGDTEPKMKVARYFFREGDGGIGNKLIVTGADGKKITKPQTILDSLIGKVAFDPSSFLSATPDKQFDILKRMIDGYDFAAEEAADKEDMEKRRDINRDAAKARAAADEIAIPLDAPENVEDVSALIAQMASASATNDAAGRAAAAKERAVLAADRQKLEADAKSERASALMEEAEALMKEAQEERDAAVVAIRAAEKMEVPERVDVSDLQARIAEAQKTADLVTARKRKQELEAEASRLEAQSAAYTARMAERQKKRDTAIANADLPVSGLGLANGIVTYKGLPLNQASDAQQLMVAVSITAKLTPEFKVAYIRDGSKLDHKSFKMLEDFCQRTGMQAWVETVESDREAAVVIEEGKVKE